MTADQVRQAVLDWLRLYPEAGCAVYEQDKWKVIGMMSDAVRLGATYKEANRRRKEVLAWLFRDHLGKPNASSLSSKELPADCWWALWMYTEPWFDASDNAWKPKDGFADAMVVCWVAMGKWFADMNALCGMEAEDAQVS
jgi:hypothetical protein